MKDAGLLVENHRRYFMSNQTKPVEFRRRQLQLLKEAITARQDAILEALKQDLNKVGFEGYATEVGLVLEEIDYLLRHLNRFARPKRAKASITQLPATCRVMPEPYGAVLIMSPWNYPFQLTMSPLAGAIAAGNCVAVKPSNYSPNTTRVIREILTDTFAEEYISVAEGGRDVNTSLLEQNFDYIFFTGSIAVGKTVMTAAAKYLTPVTLELGGKSPCIVDETADIDLAGKRISWGKFLNAGQTCVAPDYVLVHDSVKQRLIEAIWRNVQAFYGTQPHKNEEYPKIITQKHFERVLGLIEEKTKPLGGNSDLNTRQIEPTLLQDADWDCAAMQEEIFGPVLPVIGYRDVDDIIVKIKQRAKPLALYLFTKSDAMRRKVLGEVSFGGGCVNDVIVHMATTHMPFGGVGESGMGRYHGKASFDTFSHYKSILKSHTFLDVPLRYPPYKNKLKWLEKLM